MYYGQILKENIDLEREIHSLDSQIQQLPLGSLQLKKSYGQTKIYIKQEHSLTYVNKTLYPTAEKLAIKKYLILKKEELQKEHEFFTSYLEFNENNPSKSELLLSQDSVYQKLLSSHFKLTNNDYIEWMNAPFDCNKSHPENLVHTSFSGHLLRSKSESLIDLSLYMNQIPFRYECALSLGDITIYPDFTVMHPISKKIIRWEHFGMMDNPEYSNHTYQKLQLYTQFGYIPTINLITTFETKDHPLTLENVNQVIKQYFL